MTPDRIADVYRYGVCARKRKVSLASNPYFEDFGEANAWSAGWLAQDYRSSRWVLWVMGLLTLNSILTVIYLICTA